MVIPDLVVVVDNSSAEAPGWVDTSSGDGDGGQVNHENSEPNRKRSQYLHVLHPNTNPHIHTKFHTRQRNSMRTVQEQVYMYITYN